MVVATYAPADNAEQAVFSVGLPKYATEGLVRILDEKGQALSQGFAEISGDRLLVRGLNPSGAVATAYFGRQQRRFRLVLPDGATRMASMRSCRWLDGERVCEFTVFPQHEAPSVSWDEELAGDSYMPKTAASFSRN